MQQVLQGDKRGAGHSGGPSWSATSAVSAGAHWAGTVTSIRPGSSSAFLQSRCFCGLALPISYFRRTERSFADLI
jgi:hypothetical protein